MLVGTLSIYDNKKVVNKMKKEKGIDATQFVKRQWNFKKSKSESYLEININFGYLNITYMKTLY